MTTLILLGLALVLWAVERITWRRWVKRKRRETEERLRWAREWRHR